MELKYLIHLFKSPWSKSLKSARNTEGKIVRNFCPKHSVQKLSFSIIFNRWLVTELAQRTMVSTWQRFTSLSELFLVPEIWRLNSRISWKENTLEFMPSSEFCRLESKVCIYHVTLMVGFQKHRQNLTNLFSNSEPNHNEHHWQILMRGWWGAALIKGKGLKTKHERVSRALNKMDISAPHNFEM